MITSPRPLITEKNVKSGEAAYQSQLTPRDTRVSSVVKTLPIPKKRPEMAMSVIGTSIAFPNDWNFSFINSLLNEPLQTTIAPHVPTQAKRKTCSAIDTK